MCEAATSPPVPFHSPFTRPVPRIIHPEYEWKTWRQKAAAESGGWMDGWMDGGETVTWRGSSPFIHPTGTRASTHRSYLRRRGEKKLDVLVPDLIPPLVLSTTDLYRHRNPTAEDGACSERGGLAKTEPSSVMLPSSADHTLSVFMSPDAPRAAVALNSQPRHTKRTEHVP